MTLKLNSKRSDWPVGVAVRIVRLPHAEGLTLPAYQSTAAAGMGLVAAVPADAPLTLAPGARALVPTGLTLALPEGYEAQVRPRSGLALRHGVTVLNSPGTIDSDYRGEVQVLLINLGNAAWQAVRGERIAQLVVQPVARADVVEVTALDDTARGAGGFGSTGVRTMATLAINKQAHAARKPRKGKKVASASRIAE